MYIVHTQTLIVKVTFNEIDYHLIEFRFRWNFNISFLTCETNRTKNNNKIVTTVPMKLFIMHQ